MANNLGTLQAAQIILQRSLTLTFTRFPQLRLFCKGFKEYDGRVEQMGLGQDAFARKLGSSSVGNFGDSASDFTMTDVPIKLRNFPQIYHKFTVEELNQSGNMNLLDQVALPVGLKLAQTIVERVAKLVCNANFNVTKNGKAPILEVANGWTRANTILPLKELCDERGIPSNMTLPTINGVIGGDSNRFCILNSTVETKLQEDAMIVAESNNAYNNAAIRDGRLPTIAGFDFFNYAQMPNTDGNLLGFAGCADALGYVARAPRTPWDLMPDLPKTALMSVVQDPTTGFQVMVIIEGQVGDLSVHMRVIWLDGLSAVNTDNLVRLVSGAIAGTSGQLVGLTVTNPGYAYRHGGTGAYAAPTVTISGGGGTGATATATISTNGAVTGLTITNAGSGYTSAPTVTFTPASNGNAAAAASAVASIAGLK